MLAERLKMLRNQRNLTQKQLAENIQTTQQNIGHWEKGIRNPKYEMLQKLSLFFDVSIDYLQGKTDNPSGNFDKDLEEALDNALSFNGKPMSENDREKIKAYLTDYFKNKDDDLS